MVFDGLCRIPKKYKGLQKIQDALVTMISSTNCTLTKYSNKVISPHSPFPLNNTEELEEPSIALTPKNLIVKMKQYWTLSIYNEILITVN